MTTGEPPTAPKPWTVFYNDALLAWLDTEPALWLVDRVLDWIAQLRDTGPPHEGVSTDPEDDRYLAPIPGTGTERTVVATYRVIADDREQLIIVNSIE